MTSETIFSATPEPVTQTTAPVSATITQLPPEVAELVGLGKKYASTEDALKSVPHAQKHIKTLEEELAVANAELSKRKTAEELLNEIKSGISTDGALPPSQFTPDMVEQVVSQQLEKRQLQQTATQNIKQVTSAFSAKFGDKAEEVYNSLAVDAGLSVSVLNQLAATSPTAVLKLAGLAGTKVVPPAHPSSDVNISGMSHSQDTSGLTSRVRPGASTKEVVNAWKIAGQKVGKQN